MRTYEARPQTLLRWAYPAGVFCVWWAAAWAVLGDAMLPRGAGFWLCVIYVVSVACGHAVRLLAPRMPPLLGMLLAGLVVRNASSRSATSPGSDAPLLGHDFDWWSAVLRAAALGVIMLRAGLGIDLAKLRAMGLRVDAS